MKGWKWAEANFEVKMFQEGHKGLFNCGLIFRPLPQGLSEVFSRCRDESCRKGEIASDSVLS